ncbi:ferric-dicitrate binding protein FerR, regulates iron transport through sigma-19 [Catalinimonas alkaloidigena]|uniref:Ferric-dicitrate binding protein FerR, regulates iron transport through sigma-19 n=1 Tax=Catalinimonas alkaloidigena TaxID=1075417 RepID=A0A1G9RFK0_9BACT|nr:FecR domain-containing protein [Catalinimonas alkaloidigena]SDM21941.1 ferric-dicitrate binding protein FerR, regulates iron transport through sigma-19 [Catalinimonas alkaloidigena]
MDFDHYTREDFIADESFQNWVWQAQPHNVAFWDAWVAAHPEKQATVEAARQWILGLQLRETMPSEAEIDDSLTALRARLAAAPLSTTPMLPTPRPFWRQHALKIAASLLLLLGALAVVWFYGAQWQRETLATRFGETRKILLPDRSVVVLNANSRLSYASDWSDEGNREVWLEGEAYFTVKQEPRPDGFRKFVVHTSDLDVEVIGTQFNVTNRRARTQVVLQEGKVRLDLKTEQTAPVEMRPGDLVEYSLVSKQLRQRRVEPELYTSWKDDRLIVKDKSIREIASLIEETYGLSVVIQDSALARLEIRGTFSLADLDQLTRELAIAAEIRITREGDRLVFQP